MEDGLLSLKWNNHKSTFFHILSNLRRKESYTDATIACEGKFYPVHKLVMSTCSDYFGDIFQRTACKSPVVILKDIRYQELEALLDYMYLGEVDVKQSELAGLIKAAECLRIKGLAVPDEDPTSTPKKYTHVPDNRSSPAVKRSRHDSESSDDPHFYTPHSKGLRSHSPTNQSSVSSRSHSNSSTPVPSQTAEVESASHIPSQLMPPPTYSSSGSHNANESIPHQQSDSLVPVDLIKVEVDEDKGESSKNQSQSLSHQAREHREGDGGGGGRAAGSLTTDKEQQPLSNSYSEYSDNAADIEKEEHDQQMDAYNGSEIAGPSGVQGASHLMGWGDEEGAFPHNLFGNEEQSHQQVCIATMDPELVAVKMFQGSKCQVQQIGLHPLQRVQHDDALVQISQQNSGQTKVYLLQEQPQHQSLETQQLKEVHIVQRPAALQPSKQGSQKQRRRQQQQQLQGIQSVQSEAAPSATSLQPTTIVSSVQLQHIQQQVEAPLQAIHILPHSLKEVGLRSKESEELHEVELGSAEDSKVSQHLSSLEEEEEEITSHDKLQQLHSIEITTPSETPLHLKGVESSSSQSASGGTSTSPQDLSSRPARSHECPYCHYKTRSKVDLSKHVRVHTKEKPYKCSMCKYETGDRSNYRRHLVGVHKNHESEIQRHTQSESQSHHPQHEIVGLAPDDQMTSNPLAMSVQTIEVIAMPFPTDHCSSSSSPHAT